MTKCLGKMTVLVCIMTFCYWNYFLQPSVYAIFFCGFVKSCILIDWLAVSQNPYRMYYGPIFPYSRTGADILDVVVLTSEDFEMV